VNKAMSIISARDIKYLSWKFLNSMALIAFPKN